MNKLVTTLVLATLIVIALVAPVTAAVNGSRHPLPAAQTLGAQHVIKSVHVNLPRAVSATASRKSVTSRAQRTPSTDSSARAASSATPASPASTRSVASVRLGIYSTSRRRSIKGPSTPPTTTVIPPVTVTPTATVVPTPTPTSRWVGFFQQGTPSDMAPLINLETAVGAHSKVVNWYIADGTSFPLSQVQRVSAHGSIPLITLEFWSTQTGGVATIADGSKDAYLNSFADAAKAYGGEVWIRPLHEMNGNWYPWSGTTNGNTPAQVVAAWRHIHDVFVARGAKNVKFVWCVNNDNVPSTTANSADRYFPGDAYIDYTSIDGYNWGISDPSWSTWRSFGSLIGSSYTKVTALSSKPLFIAEIGCPEAGGSKAAWITDMFAQISAKYTKIQGVCWFNVDARQTQNADWRVDSSATSVQAFKAGVAKGF